MTLEIPVHLKPDLVPIPYRFIRICLTRIRNCERCDGKQSFDTKRVKLKRSLAIQWLKQSIIWGFIIARIALLAEKDNNSRILDDLNLHSNVPIGEKLLLIHINVINILLFFTLRKTNILNYCILYCIYLLFYCRIVAPTKNTTILYIYIYSAIDIWNSKLDDWIIDCDKALFQESGAFS